MPFIGKIGKYWSESKPNDHTSSNKFGFQDRPKRKPGVNPMKRLQACIYKDFTYKFLWIQQVFDKF